MSALVGNVNDAFMLVSVRSNIFSNRWNEIGPALQQAPFCMTYILLDALEIYNRLMHADISVSDAGDNSDTTHLRERLNATNVRAILTWSEIEQQPLFSEYLRQLQACFHADIHFRREVVNQSFRNLQPRLRPLNVKNSRDPRMATFAQYLLHEIACKLYLSQEGKFEHEILSAPEMGIMRSIYARRYARLEEIVRRQPQYLDLGSLWCATFLEGQEP